MSMIMAVSLRLVYIDPTPQEVPWSAPLTEDQEHAHYDPAQVGDYFAAATQAALVLAAFRAPYRGRSTPVNAWWGSFDLAVNLFSGQPAQPPSDDFIMRNAMDAQEVAIGWWPGDPRYDRPRSTPTPIRRLRASVRPKYRLRAHGGTRAWASTSWTGMTSARRPTRRPPRWSLPARRSDMPARSASGPQGSPRARLGPRHP